MVTACPVIKDKIKSILFSNNDKIRTKESMVEILELHSDKDMLFLLTKEVILEVLNINKTKK
jgi:hypothetical protein